MANDAQKPRERVANRPHAIRRCAVRRLLYDRSDVSERFTVTASIANGPAGALRLTVLAARPEEALVVAPTVLTVTMWRDGADIVRIALHHRSSRSLAYVQGNRALLELWKQIRLQLVPTTGPDLT